jgi:hypothetical protein
MALLLHLMYLNDFKTLQDLKTIKNDFKKNKEKIE